MLAAMSFVAAVAVLLWQSFCAHDPEKLYVNQVAALAKEAEEAAEEEAEEISAEETEQPQTPEENQ